MMRRAPQFQASTTSRRVSALRRVLSSFLNSILTMSFIMAFMNRASISLPKGPYFVVYSMSM
jgi:hypothetical protein